MPDNAQPTISIITPTYNSARFLEATIQSILNQNYPALEYIIIDGGSTDGTLDIIKAYEGHLAFWLSEPDNGMYDALQKGFEQSTGHIMAWLNSDDLYTPWALHTVAELFRSLPQIDWLTSIRPLLWDENNHATDCMALTGYSKRGFFRAEHLSGHSRFSLEAIQQESTFWRRSLWEKAGAKLDGSLRLAGDFELWARFYQHSDLVGVRVPIGGFRNHGNQLSIQEQSAYIQEAHDVLQRYGGRPHNLVRSFARQWVAPLFRKRLRRFGMATHICYPAPLCTYNQQTKTWQIRTTYI